jgi:hypothetical protein
VAPIASEQATVLVAGITLLAVQEQMAVVVAVQAASTQAASRLQAVQAAPTRFGRRHRTAQLPVRVAVAAVLLVARLPACPTSRSKAVTAEVTVVVAVVALVFVQAQ